MARRRSGASAFFSSLTAGAVRFSDTCRRTSSSEMFRCARNRAAGPSFVWSIASSRWPVSAFRQPIPPAS